jgi:hypothetical protein
MVAMETPAPAMSMTAKMTLYTSARLRMLSKATQLKFLSNVIFPLTEVRTTLVAKLDFIHLLVTPRRIAAPDFSRGFQPTAPV